MSVTDPSEPHSDKVGQASNVIHERETSMLVDGKDGDSFFSLAADEERQMAALEA